MGNMGNPHIKEACLSVMANTLKIANHFFRIKVKLK